jgi:transposase InsO family protein
MASFKGMCYYSWENPYAERTNGLIKNRYLNIWKPRSLGQLISLQKKVVRHHDEYQKKGALNMLSPVQFERDLLDESKPTLKYELRPRQPKNRNK